MIGFSNSPVKNTTCEVKVTMRSGTHHKSDDGKTIYYWGGYIDKKRFDWTKYNYMIFLDGWKYNQYNESEGYIVIFDLNKNKIVFFVYVDESAEVANHLTSGNRWHSYSSHSSSSDNFVKINNECIEFYYTDRNLCPETVMFI